MMKNSFAVSLLSAAVLVSASVFSSVTVFAETASKTDSENKQPSPEKENTFLRATIRRDNLYPEWTGGISGKIIMYVPNLLADFLDIFSFSLKLGPAIGAEARITRAFGLAAVIGPCGELLWGPNRQYGFALKETACGQFLCVSDETTTRFRTIGNSRDYWQFGSNFPLPSDELYGNRIAARDYWAIEAGAICLAGFEFGIHPVQIADFVCGVFMYDLLDDDYHLRPLIY